MPFRRPEDRAIVRRHAPGVELERWGKGGSDDPEQLDVPGTQRRLREEWRDDLDIAAVVLTHGIPAEYPPEWPIEEDEALWRNLHRDLATRFTNSRLVIAENSGHDVHVDEPELVAEAVRSVLAGRGDA